MYKKQKIISQKERTKNLIIQSKTEILKIIRILRNNNIILEMYNEIKNNESFPSARINMRNLILENLEYYKLLKSEKNFLKNRVLELKKDQEKPVKNTSVFIESDVDEYDNLARDTARENFEKQGWDNYLYNFSK